MNPEQDMVRAGLSRFLAARYSLDSSRAAAKTGPGWQPEMWRAFAEELGILGATMPESAGGSGGRGTEAMVISEELGRALVIEPFIDTVIVAGGLLSRAGGEVATAVLERVAEDRRSSPSPQRMPMPVNAGMRCPPTPFATAMTGSFRVRRSSSSLRRWLPTY